MLAAVKAGHLRDARLTLLTCLHQQDASDSMAERQLSHDASQNKERRSHTRSPSSSHNAHLCLGRRPPFSWNQKAASFWRKSRMAGGGLGGKREEDDASS